MKTYSRTARHEYADMFEIAYHTAMRWGEFRLLEWRMIDWRKNTLILPVEIT
jgi:integrase